jgi:hypothetical protein
MLIETTLHVHKKVMNKLDEGIAKTGISRSSIIKLLFRRIMDNSKRMIKAYSRIKYQERDEKENWNQLHIVLNEYEYEYCLDMRKFYKMSVSLILAYAVTKYLNELVNELLNGNISIDNYLYINYIFMMETVSGILCWKIFWGIPPQLTVLLRRPDFSVG